MNKETLCKVLHTIIKTINDKHNEQTAEYNYKDYENMFDSKSPEENHQSWMSVRLKDGWAYGDVKDIEKKIHPCLVPYNQLPEHQKMKNYIAQGIINYYNYIQNKPN